jgi:hypothetical protein
MNATLRTLASSAGIAAVLLALGGCGEDKKPQNDEADAGEQGPPKPVVDKKLAAAVKAAESAQAAGKGTDGPPESGVFGPGLADKAFAPGAPPKLEVVTAGAEPRFKLVPAPAEEQKVTATITRRTQGGALQVEYGLALKIDKGKDDKKDDKKADAPKGWRVLGKVASIGMPPQIPRELGDKLGKLKGTELRYTIGPSGGLSDVALSLPKDADASLADSVLNSLVDSLAAAIPPVPADPVGAGGYWMVTDRTTSFGVQLIRYRVYKVEKIDKDGASLSLDVREYAAKEDVDLAGQKLTLAQFQATGKGKVDWVATSLLSRGETSQRTALMGTVPGGQQGGIQAEVLARFTAGADDKKDDKKK